MSEPRRIPIHRSLNRPNLLWGAEREAVLSLLVLIAMVIFTASSWIQVVLAVVIWVALYAVLRAMAKADPQMINVYIRHVRYRSFYSAKSGFFAKEIKIKDWED